MTRIFSILTLGVSLALASGCIDDPDAVDELDEGLEGLEAVAAAATCAPGSDAYSPYSGTSPTGTVAALPWRGAGTTYPDGVEDFRSYALPSSVECGSTRSLRSHVDVTAGCLTAVSLGSGLSRGQITSTSDGAFRAIALGFVAGNAQAVKWTSTRNEYRFHYTRASGAGTLPGFKAFVRYVDEDNLYVASWRLDGVVQIQKKHCGVYTALAVKKTHGAPSAGAWHTLRFEAVGTRLDLYLDGAKILTATDGTFAAGTAGIRTDAMTGAYLDDWRVY